MKLLVTGGLGFIGSAVIRHFAAQSQNTVLNIDKCTYAGNPASVADADTSRYRHVHRDICDAGAMREAFTSFRPDAVLHLARFSDDIDEVGNHVELFQQDHGNVD